MPTQKFQPDESVAYDRVPVQFKTRIGVREKLKTVPNWQDRLRAFVDQLLEELPKKTN